jgi:hypothetical protein
MTTKRWLLLGAAVGLAVLFLAAACTDDDDGGEPAGETPVDTPMETPMANETPAGATVEVLLYEWTVSPDPESVAAGTVTFDAENIGLSPHNLVVLRTDFAPDALPTNADGSANEAGEGVVIVGGVDELSGSASGSVSLELEPGNYVLICNIVEQNAGGGDPTVHYARGMTAAFTVTG